MKIIYESSLLTILSVGMYFCIKIYVLPKYVEFCSNLPPKSSTRFLHDSKQHLVAKLQSLFPSPHSELLTGLVLGTNDIKDNKIFNDSLIITGTVHVVVVSGFNISLIYKFIERLFAKVYTKRNFIFINTLTLFYALYTGFEAPVVRAWIMCLLASFAKFTGRRTPILWILLISALLMILTNKWNLCSLSYILSFTATLSLVLFNEFFKILFLRYNLTSAIFDDLCTTISASVLVWPIISVSFGRVSLIAPLVNMVTLWTVPITTSLGLIVLSLLFLRLYYISKVVLILTYPFLEYFVSVVNFFGALELSSISFKLSFVQSYIYYLACFLLLYKFYSRKIPK